MKIKSSLKSIKKRDLNSKLVRRRGRVYIINKNNNCHYSISNKQSYTILDVAKMFGQKIKFLQARSGERYASALISMSLSRKVIKLFGHKKLKDYIKNIIK